MNWKLTILLIGSCSIIFGFGYHDQIAISKKSNEIYTGNYAVSPIFNDQFTEQGPYQFTVGRTQAYQSNKVKRVNIHDIDGNLMFFCRLDTTGKVTEHGYQVKNYFIVHQSTQIDPFSHISVTKYFRDNWLMKVDSVLGYYQDYKNGDTSLYYSRDTRIHYLLGEVINERNVYYNEKYLNKTVVYDVNNVFIQPMIFYGDPKEHKYYTTAYKTDYYKGKLYKISHTIATSGFHYYAGQTKLERDILEWHPFFKGVSDKDQYLHFVDGAGFNEPRKTYERMWCGSSLYRSRYHYDNGVRYRYSKRPDGLYDSYYSDYYKEDTTPLPKKEKKAQPNDSTKNVLVVSNVWNTPLHDPYYKPIRRVSTPITTELFCFSYEFY